MSNNPKKFIGLKGYGLCIVERVPSHTAPNPENIRYLQTKRARMGHMLGNLDDELDGDLAAALGDLDNLSELDAELDDIGGSDLDDELDEPESEALLEMN